MVNRIIEPDDIISQPSFLLLRESNRSGIPGGLQLCNLDVTTAMEKKRGGEEGEGERD